jgi:hypothetical protein
LLILLAEPTEKCVCVCVCVCVDRERETHTHTKSADTVGRANCSVCVCVCVYRKRLLILLVEPTARCVCVQRERVFILLAQQTAKCVCVCVCVQRERERERWSADTVGRTNCKACVYRHTETRHTIVRCFDKKGPELPSFLSLEQVRIPLWPPLRVSEWEVVAEP